MKQVSFLGLPSTTGAAFVDMYLSDYANTAAAEDVGTFESLESCGHMHMVIFWGHASHQHTGEGSGVQIRLRNVCHMS